MTGHDAFFSYSNADNAAHNEFVTDFRNMLKKVVAARLRLQFPKVKFVDEMLDFFIDHEGLPANGPISDSLREHVGKSEFLFILVGKGYLDSEYCQREREWFRAAFDQNEQTALGRTFLIFMTGEALTMTGTSARSRPSRAGRMRRRRGKSFASPTPWSTFGAGATASRPSLWCWTSMIRSMSCTVSRWHNGMPITMSAVICRSMSTIRTLAGRL
jgi:hypothetical protein